MPEPRTIEELTEYVIGFYQLQPADEYERGYVDGMRDLLLDVRRILHLRRVQLPLTREVSTDA